MTLRQKTIARLQELECSPKRSLGQNFLINESVVQRILRAKDVFSAGTVIEIGPGLGALTEHLDPKVTILLEMDRKFARYWAERDYSVWEGDALDAGWEDMDLAASVVMGNLPYQIAGRLTVDLSVCSERPLGLVFMYQKEVAERICARPNSENYGFLSVVAQIFWRPEKICDVGPKDFYPVPGVGSRVLSFFPKQRDVSAQRLTSLVKQAFSSRRKKLVSNVSALYPASDVKAALERLGYSDGVRAQQVSPEHFVDLLSYFRSR